MDGRYKRIFDYAPARQSPDCKVQILKGAILWDSVRKASVVQVKYRNVSSGGIRSLHAKLYVYDHEGMPIATGLEQDIVRYIDVGAGPMESFGDNIPIVIESETVRSFEVFVQRIIWEDNTVEDIDEQSYVDYRDQEPLGIDSEYLDWYKNLCGSNGTPKYRPRLIGADGGWQCACGKISRADRCDACGAVREAAFRYSDQKEILEHLEELRRQEEAERRKREALKRKAAKRVRWLVALACGAAAVVLLVLGGMALKEKMEELAEERRVQAIIDEKRDQLNALIEMDDEDFNRELSDKVLEYVSGYMAYREDYTDEFNRLGDDIMFDNLPAVPCGVSVADGENRYALVDCGKLLYEIYDVYDDSFEARWTLPGKIQDRFRLYIKYNGEEYLTPYDPKTGMDSSIMDQYIAGIDSNMLYIYNNNYMHVGFNRYNLETKEFDQTGVWLSDSFRQSRNYNYTAIEPYGEGAEKGNYTRRNIANLVYNGRIYFMTHNWSGKAGNDGRYLYYAMEYIMRTEKIRGEHQQLR